MKANAGEVYTVYNPVSYTHLDVYKRQDKLSVKEYEDPFKGQG